MIERDKFRETLLVLCYGFILAATSPVYMRQFGAGESGRNIRHLPCASRVSGEMGVCMFAVTCANVNGAYLGICTDHLYFGSCCKIDKNLDGFSDKNTIDDGPTKSYLANPGSIESNISEYLPKLISTSTKSPFKITEAPIETTKIHIKVVEKPLLTITTVPVLKPAKATVNRTNKHPIIPASDFKTDTLSLPTFQPLQNNLSGISTTPQPTPEAISKPPLKISTTVPAAASGNPNTSGNKLSSTVMPSRWPITQNGTKVEANSMYNPTTITVTATTTIIIKQTIKQPSLLSNSSISEDSSRPTDKPAPIASSTMEKSTRRPSLPTVASIHMSTDNFMSMTAELNMSNYKKVCGRRLLPKARIVGGTPSSFGKWPWQISLQKWRMDTYSHICGAALLNANWAITAAHCGIKVPARDLLLRLGENDLERDDEPYGFQERRVQLSAAHPKFDPLTFEYDLALLRFYKPLSPFQPNTLPICLPDDDESYVGRTAYVTGWGRLSDGGPLASVLQEVPVRIISNTVCEEMYQIDGVKQILPNTFICAGSRRGGRDACDGDSGGPLVVQRSRDKRWILAGTVSWGIGCAAPNRPGVYTRISEFRTWINRIIKY